MTKFETKYNEILCELIVVNKKYIDSLIERFNRKLLDINTLAKIIISRFPEISKQPNSLEMLTNHLRDSIKEDKLQTTGEEIYHLFNLKNV